MKRLKFLYIASLIASFLLVIFWATSVGVAQEPDPASEPESESESEIYTKTVKIPMEELGLSAPNATYTVTLGAWRNMRPTESYLRRISMLPPDIPIDCVSPDQASKGWVVGDAGTILGYCNGLWEQYIGPESIPTALYDVHALDHDLAVAVGDDGAILHYLYDEIVADWVWMKSSIPVGNERLLGVSMVKDGSTGNYYGWAVGTANSSGKGVLIKGELTLNTAGTHDTYDYTWTNLTSSYSSLPTVDYYHDVVMVAPNDGWAVGGDASHGVILHWNGSKWSVFQQTNTTMFRAIHMLSPNDGWVVGVGGIIYHFNGSTWVSVNSPTTVNLTSVGVDADGTLWATGLGGVILKNVNGNWTLFTDLRTDPFDFRDLDFKSGHGWLIAQNTTLGIGGQILEYDDNAWVAATVPTDNRLNAVSNVSENEAWAVGHHDASGGTIIHWDGKHWQRWYQEDVPIPSVDFYALDMVSKNYGWAAGDPREANGPAVMLQWDGHRWAEIVFKAPVNVRINSLALLNNDFGWAVAYNGNAVARWNGLSGQWNAFSTCGGVWYNIRSVSITPMLGYDYGDAWAVGDSLNPVTGEYWLRYANTCSGSYKWDQYQQPASPDGGKTDGPTATDLRGISMMQEDGIGTWGYAVGNYGNRACIYAYSETTGNWSIVHCDVDNTNLNTPSRLYSTDIVDESGVGWFAGYFDPTYNNSKKQAYIYYLDASGLHQVNLNKIYPINGMNIYHRPILSLDMASDTMGWAVGAYRADVSDNKDLSVIYQYPYPNFTLDIDPLTRVVKPGNSATYTISVNSIGGFDANVSLSIDNDDVLPLGISSTINPTSTNSESSSVVTLHTTTSTPLQLHEIPLEGYSLFRSGDYNIPVRREFDLNLIVTDHPIYSIEPSHGTVSTTVTIHGEGFGPDPGAGNRSTGVNHVTWGGIQLEDSYIHSWSDTQITFQVPDDPTLFWPEKFPLIGEVMVTANGDDSNNNYTFQLDNFISSITSNYASGEVIGTIYGTSFGIDPGESLRSTSYEHIAHGSSWINTYDVQYWSNNIITFTTTSFVPMTLTVTSNGFESNAVTFPEGMQVYLPITIR